MDLIELYRYINERLGVNPEEGETRSDNFAYLWSRAYFCTFAKIELDECTTDISLVIGRIEAIVNRDIRNLRRLRQEKDFVSHFVVSRYDELRTELLTKY